MLNLSLSLSLILSVFLSVSLVAQSLFPRIHTTVSSARSARHAGFVGHCHPSYSEHTSLPLQPLPQSWEALEQGARGGLEGKEPSPQNDCVSVCVPVCMCVRTVSESSVPRTVSESSVPGIGERGREQPVPACVLLAPAARAGK